MAYRSPVFNSLHEIGDFIVENLLTGKEVSKILGLPASLLQRKHWEGSRPKYIKFDQSGHNQHLDSRAHLATCKRVLNFTILPIHGGS